MNGTFVEELSELLELDTDEVIATLSSSIRHVSMDSPLSEGEESTLIDVMENPNAESTDEQIGHNDSLKQEIERSLKTLTESQQEVSAFSLVSDQIIR